MGATICQRLPRKGEREKAWSNAKADADRRMGRIADAHNRKHVAGMAQLNTTSMNECAVVASSRLGERERQLTREREERVDCGSEQPHQDNVEATTTSSSEERERIPSRT